ncbi:hypothetical protein HK100_006597 [Physocladia obscura]|uniref:Heterokaryon incompatibility domain-containing protein n=1 Tax=Physocladia obscura TaxID=109957 RepID=A0AAD5XF55_9FUNG|nr:hypothetical protein HK100_006597 [Physocladia obscura]
MEPAHTMNNRFKSLSDPKKQIGSKPFRPEFPHNSTVSIRVWCAKEEKFVRIRVGEGILDDTPLIAVSHTWNGAIDTDNLPCYPNYTKNIFKAVKTAAKDQLQGDEQENYYVWLDYFCTNQLNPSEVREATMKMSWVYATARFAVVILDTSLPYGVLNEQAWSRRMWTMQEEFLSTELVFFDRDGNKETEANEAEDGKIFLPIIRDDHNYYDQNRVLIATGHVRDPNMQIQKQEFKVFWPKVAWRSSFMPCDMVYATQYCSKLQTYLDIRYDLELFQVLALYLQRLIEAGDRSVTAVHMIQFCPGWGCTSVLAQSKYKITNPLGFIGGLGLFGGKPVAIELKKSRVFLILNGNGKLVIELNDSLYPDTAETICKLFEDHAFDASLKTPDFLMFATTEEVELSAVECTKASPKVSYGTAFTKKGSSMSLFGVFLGESLNSDPYLIFGTVVEGLDLLTRLEELPSICLSGKMPLENSLKLEPVVSLLIDATVVLARVNVKEESPLMVGFDETKYSEPADGKESKMAWSTWSSVFLNHPDKGCWKFLKS